MRVAASRQSSGNAARSLSGSSPRPRRSTTHVIRPVSETFRAHSIASSMASKSSCHSASKATRNLAVERFPRRRMRRIGGQVGELSAHRLAVQAVSSQYHSSAGLSGCGYQPRGTVPAGVCCSCIVCAVSRAPRREGSRFVRYKSEDRGTAAFRPKQPSDPNQWVRKGRSPEPGASASTGGPAADQAPRLARLTHRALRVVTEGDRSG